MYQSQNAEAVMVLLEETNGSLPSRPGCVLVLCRWNEARNRESMAARVCHNLLKQIQMLISPRQAAFRVRKVQEGSVILILFLCWFVNYYFSIVQPNMWGSIVRPAAPVKPLQWVHCLSCLTSLWGLMNFWTKLWSFLTPGKSTLLHRASLSCLTLLRDRPICWNWQ